jgi:hypothetical protein
MKYLIAIALCFQLCGCSNQSIKGDVITYIEFEQLLNKVSKGWSEGNAQLAADSFHEDAVYIEPPDKQLYIGRSELFEFFGGDKGRSNSMTMEWHNIIFNSEKQMGTGEYTFGYKGKLTHGIVIIQIKNEKISPGMLKETFSALEDRLNDLTPKQQKKFLELQLFKKKGIEDLDNISELFVEMSEQEGTRSELFELLKNQEFISLLMSEPLTPEKYSSTLFNQNGTDLAVV